MRIKKFLQIFFFFENKKIPTCKVLCQQSQRTPKNNDADDDVPQSDFTTCVFFLFFVSFFFLSKFKEFGFEYPSPNYTIAKGHLLGQ